MIILVFLITFKVLFIMFPGVILTAAREGLVLWLNSIMPALLPFMIITNMLVSLGFARYLGEFLSPVTKKIFCLPGAGGFALITGLTSGYPIGAKTVADLRMSGELSKSDAQHLLAFCNNAGPLFILGVVGVGFFGSPAIGYVLWAGHVFSALLLGVLLRFVPFIKKQEGSKNIRITPSCKFSISPGKAFGDSVRNAMESMTIIGGLVIFFSAVMAALGEIGLPDTGLLAGLIAGIIEVTSGVSKISESGVSTASLGFAAFAIAFGGLSIHMQALHFTEGTGIKAIPYIICKVLHGILAFAITIFLARLFV